MRLHICYCEIKGVCPLVPHIFFEEDGVSAVYLVADTLCKSSELVGEGFYPSLFFVALYEVTVLLGLTGDRVSDGVCLRDCNIVCPISVL